LASSFRPPHLKGIGVSGPIAAFAPFETSLDQKPRHGGEQAREEVDHRPEPPIFHLRQIDAHVDHDHVPEVQAIGEVVFVDPQTPGQRLERERGRQQQAGQNHHPDHVHNAVGRYVFEVIRQRRDAMRLSERIGGCRYESAKIKGLLGSGALASATMSDTPWRLQSFHGLLDVFDEQSG